MKRITKQFLSLLLVFTLVIGCSGSIFAKSYDVQGKNRTTQTMQIEALEKEKEEMLVSVMEQLKAQNGENQYFIYKEIIDAKFEAMEKTP